MQEWERQLQRWARENVTLDSINEIDVDMVSEMREVEQLELDLSRSSH